MISLDVALDFWLSERSVENRDRLICTYSYLCVRGARKFLRPGLERNDLEQVASIGLLKACERYDPAFKTPFEAYAWLYIVGELMHHVRDSERLVRPPRKLRSLERQWLSRHDELTLSLGRSPSDEELAHVMSVEVQTIAELRQCRSRAVADSLDASSVDFDYSAGVNDIEALVDRLVIEEALSILSDIEKAIVLGVYTRGFSQLEIARRLGYSQRHVSRLHRNALKKMSPLWVRP